MNNLTKQSTHGWAIVVRALDGTQTIHADGMGSFGAAEDLASDVFNGYDYEDGDLRLKWNRHGAHTLGDGRTVWIAAPGQQRVVNQGAIDLAIHEVIWFFDQGDAQGVREQWLEDGPLMRKAMVDDIVREAYEDWTWTLEPDAVWKVLNATPAQGYEIRYRWEGGEAVTARVGRYWNALNVMSDLLGDGFVAAASEAALMGNASLATWGGRTQYAIVKRGEAMAS